MGDSIMTRTVVYLSSGIRYNTAPIPSHLYFPSDAELGEYAVNGHGRSYLLTTFFGSCATLCAVTFVVVNCVCPKLSRTELLTAIWFTLSGAIHIFFEGYYSTNFASLSAKQTLLAQLWKEYAFADSRYLTDDAFVLCMETVTSFFWGPACLAVTALIMRRHPARYPLQMLVSSGQFYGLILYYATAMFDHYWWNVQYSRPEAFYFWFYFVFMNFFWFIIPGCKYYRFDLSKP